MKLDVVQPNLYAARPKGPATSAQGLSVVGLFAGIGGIELGLHRAGHKSLMLAENDPGASAVLEAHFSSVRLHGDVRQLTKLPDGVELLAGGFPCQDLSQAGATAGIRGLQSGLVDEAFRLIRSHEIPWLLLENVPFMLQLKRGEALDHIVSALELEGYRWAYRVVDSRTFGMPQRRERVYILAARGDTADPWDVLLADDAGVPSTPSLDEWRQTACGFYWTEGLRGLGWAHDAVPTLKGGSTIGIASPPAIVLRSGEIVKPDIRDAERLQGFDPGWTLPAESVQRAGHRWKLVGNAVTVDAAAWIGSRLVDPGAYDVAGDQVLARSSAWPRAAWGDGTGARFRSAASSWPVASRHASLESFLRYPVVGLSERALAGFLSRARRAKLRFPPGFLELVESNLAARRA